MQIVTSDCNLTALETDYDLHYLLKQIMGAGQSDENTKMRYRVTFAEQLQCEQGKLVLNANAILKKRNEVFHLRARTSTLEDVKCTFQAARELLECFGQSAAYAFTELGSLEE